MQKVYMRAFATRVLPVSCLNGSTSVQPSPVCDGFAAIKLLRLLSALALDWSPDCAGLVVRSVETASSGTPSLGVRWRMYFLAGFPFDRQLKMTTNTLPRLIVACKNSDT